MITQRKGDIGLTQAIAKFTELGYNVSIPISESTPYDLIIEIEGIIKRIQVKFCDSIDVDLRRIHTNSNGYVIKKYEKNSFDWLYIYKNNLHYLVKEDLYNRSTIRAQNKYLLK